MPTNPPVLDKRGFEDIMAQLRDSAQRYLPEWSPGDDSDPGVMLQHIFARLMEIEIERLNRTPEKHLLAFLDAMGVDTLPPFPAAAPLVFSLKKGASAAPVPRGSTMMGKSPAGGMPVIFETTEDLTVLPASITCAYTMEPERGRFGDHTNLLDGGGFSPFRGDRAIREAFYFYDDNVLPLDHSADNVLEITLYKKMSPCDIFDFMRSINCYYVDDEGTRAFIPKVRLTYDLADWNKATHNIFTIELSGIQDILPQPTPEDFHKDGCQLPEIQSKKTYIKFVTHDNLKSKESVAEMMNWSISRFHVITPAATPEFLIFQNTRLDPNNFFLPFGSKPKHGDSFIVHLGEQPYKSGTTITLSIEALTLNVGRDTQWNSLVYEYSVPDGWKPLPAKSFSTDVNPFVFEFSPPADAAARKIGGVNGYWLRIALPNSYYGGEQLYNANGMMIGFAEYHFPTIRSISLSVDYKAVCYTYRRTGHIYRKHSYPYKLDISQGDQYHSLPRPEDHHEITGTHFYLGFDNFFEHQPVSLYADAETSTEDSGASGASGGVYWEYHNGYAWKPLYTQDDTDRLTKSGIIRFLTPTDAACSTLFDNTARFWVRVASGGGCRLRGLYLNAVTAEQAVTVSREALGSANGLPDQRLSLRGAPVLQGQRVWVRENESPTAAELPDTIVVARQNPLTLESDNWVLWQERSSFGASLPNSRHYIVDRERGAIIFGDGVRGMRPERGSDIAAEYRYGGGLRGILPAGAISKLTTAINGIERVYNPVPSVGGAGSEDIPGVLDRGPMAVTHRGRGVSALNIEWLAREAAGAAINRIKCLPGEGGQAYTLLLVPAVEGLRPMPDGALVARIRTYLSGRISASVDVEKDVSVIGPRYVTVDVSVEVVPENPLESSVVRERAAGRLADFLHPLTGGPEGEGWAFGRDVYLSEICEQLEAVEGVTRARAGSVLIHPSAIQRELTPRHANIRLEVSYPVGSLLSVYNGSGALIERWRTAEAIYGDKLPAKLRVTGLREGDKLSINNVRRYRNDDTRAVRTTVIDFPIGSVVRHSDGYTTTLSSAMPVGSELSSDETKKQSLNRAAIIDAFKTAGISKAHNETMMAAIGYAPTIGRTSPATGVASLYDVPAPRTGAVGAVSEVSAPKTVAGAVSEVSVARPVAVAVSGISASKSDVVSSSLLTISGDRLISTDEAIWLIDGLAARGEVRWLKDYFIAFGEKPRYDEDYTDYTLTHPDQLEVISSIDLTGGYAVTVRYLPAGFVLAPGVVVECPETKVRALVNRVILNDDNTAVLYFSECCDRSKNPASYTLSRHDGSESVSLTIEDSREITDIAYLYKHELCTPGNIEVVVSS